MMGTSFEYWPLLSALNGLRGRRVESDALFGAIEAARQSVGPERMVTSTGTAGVLGGLGGVDLKLPELERVLRQQDRGPGLQGAISGGLLGLENDQRQRVGLPPLWFGANRQKMMCLEAQALADRLAVEIRQQDAAWFWSRVAAIAGILSYAVSIWFWCKAV